MTDTTKRAVCPAVLHFQDRPSPCVLNAGHKGDHQHADGDSWSVSGLSTDVCGGMWSPGQDTVYVCTRKVRHEGFHLDDKLNVLWRECSGTYLAPVDRRSGNYLHGRSHDDLIRELFQRVSALEGGLGSVEISDLSRRVTELETTGTDADEQHRTGHGL